MGKCDDKVLSELIGRTCTEEVERQFTTTPILRHDKEQTSNAGLDIEATWLEVTFPTSK